eukprot:1145531-Pelagomonas_calceolata.AAC.3
MAVRLDSKWAPASQQQQQQQQQPPPQAGLHSTAATVAAALSILTSSPLSLSEGQASAPSLSPGGKPQGITVQQGPSSPASELSGAERALLSAHEAFLRCSRALRGAGGHSSYQRAMANCLTSMRMMHVLEDSSSGGWDEGGRDPAKRSWGCACLHIIAAQVVLSHTRLQGWLLESNLQMVLSCTAGPPASGCNFMCFVK